jgi:hypothetical protein
MDVKSLITPFQHIKKHTFSEIEPVRHIINNCYAPFVNKPGCCSKGHPGVHSWLKQKHKTGEKKF